MEDQWALAISVWKKIVLEFNKFDFAGANAPGYSIQKENDGR
jgi:hypothetical protein